MNAPFRVPTNTRTPLITYSFVNLTLQRPDPASQRPAVEMLNWNFLQVDSIETTNINCRRRIAFRIDSLRQTDECRRSGKSDA